MGAGSAAAAAAAHASQSNKYELHSIIKFRPAPGASGRLAGGQGGRFGNRLSQRQRRRQRRFVQPGGNSTKNQWLTHVKHTEPKKD